VAKAFSAADIARIFLTPDFKQHLPQEVRKQKLKMHAMSSAETTMDPFAPLPEPMPAVHAPANAGGACAPMPAAFRSG
jgi:hypothetical protein